MEEVSGETQLLTEAKVQLRLTDPDNLKNGQLLVGNTIARTYRNRMLYVRNRRRSLKRPHRKSSVSRKNAADRQRKRLPEKRKRSAVMRPQKQSAHSQSISFSDQDYEVLKRIVEAEAGGCDMQGRILVANVILNVCGTQSSRLPSRMWFISVLSFPGQRRALKQLQRIGEDGEAVNGPFPERIILRGRCSL